MSLNFFIQTASTVITAVTSSPLFILLTRGNALRNAEREAAFVAHNRNLSLRQKLIPATGLVIATGAALAAISSLAFTLPAWFPSLFALSCLGGLAYDVSFYLEERAEKLSLDNALSTLSQDSDNEGAQQKRERQAYLEHAAPRHLLNVGFDLGTSLSYALVSMSFAPARLVTPLTYLYRALPVAGIVNGLDLSLRQSSYKPHRI